MMLEWLERIKKSFLGVLVGRIDAWEDRVAAMPAVHHAVDGAPVRFEILKEKLKRENTGLDPAVAPIMPMTLLGVMQSMNSLTKNPKLPKTRAPDGFLDELEEYARRLGTSSIGYTRAPEQWIFQDKAILHLSAIVLTMEMDKARMDTAPSSASAQAVFEIYRDLGIIANRVASYLRQRGYSAHAGHPLGGLALYPPLTQRAGLGWLGANGLMITPEHGPRVRLAAVFTNIENLPFGTQNNHSWVADFCARCGVCIRECPTKAIHTEPIQHDTGRVTCVDNARCFPYFNDYHGCSVCIKVCPFNNTPYDRIKNSFPSGRSGGARQAYALSQGQGPHL
jgi:ferredoxin